MGRWRVIGFGILIAGAVGAQELEFSGYFENQFFPQELNGELVLQEYDRLRLDMAADVGENVSFAGDIVYRVFHGKTEYSAFDFMPDWVVEEYATTMGMSVDELRPMFAIQMADEHFLDNAYATFYFSRFNLRIGRQQLPWGAGYNWNPTDLFNDKNLLDPTYEKVGVNAFKLEVPFDEQGMVTGVFGVGGDWEESVKAIRVKEHVRGFDFSATVAEKEEERMDYATFSTMPMRRRLAGGDFSGSLIGLGVWGEGAFNWIEKNDDFEQYLLGVDYTFESGFYLTGEYYRNGLGETDEKRYRFADWMQMLSADGENLGRDYLSVGQSYPIGELWDWSNFLIINLNSGDRSGVFFPWFDYSFGDNTEISLVGYLPFGGNESEFGSFGSGGFARVRVYF
jgi:hypothetical protein